mmetsp:Transcript_10225/g.15484  ORF Transcript_10225/g.15484 Transcript_10225/m.15484 type:complete len:288 (-) Transcript_10225:15-878(-)
MPMILRRETVGQHHASLFRFDECRRPRIINDISHFEQRRWQCQRTNQRAEHGQFQASGGSSTHRTRRHVFCDKSFETCAQRQQCLLLKLQRIAITAQVYVATISTQRVNPIFPIIIVVRLFFFFFFLLVLFLVFFFVLALVIVLVVSVVCTLLVPLLIAVVTDFQPPTDGDHDIKSARVIRRAVFLVFVCDWLLLLSQRHKLKVFHGRIRFSGFKASVSRTQPTKQHIQRGCARSRQQERASGGESNRSQPRSYCRRSQTTRQRNRDSAKHTSRGNLCPSLFLLSPR